MAAAPKLCDWASMLFRMCTSNTGKSRAEDCLQVEPHRRRTGRHPLHATLMVKGEYATGMMNAEVGDPTASMRISPFDSNARRHTSFASVDVTPYFEGEDDDIVIPDDDLEIVAFVRSSGPGGQNVNKVASAIRIVHKPTGLQVVCTSERSQVQNRMLALNLIKAKIQKLEEAKRDAELYKLYMGEKGGNLLRLPNPLLHPRRPPRQGSPQRPRSLPTRPYPRRRHPGIHRRPTPLQGQQGQILSKEWNGLHVWNRRPFSPDPRYLRHRAGSQKPHRPRNESWSGSSSILFLPLLEA